MKKYMIAAAAVLILAVNGLMTACSQDDGGKVSTDGSTSMEKTVGMLGEAFELDHEDISFTYNPTGSGAGIKAVQEGRCDIGISSRDLRPEEEDSGLEQTVLAYDGIAVITNPENDIEDLDMMTLASIFKGDITNWKEVGGSDSEIVLVGREAGSGTRTGFESVTGTTDECVYRQELTSSGDVITTVAANPGAVGYTSLAAVKDNVKVISVEGVLPSEKTIKTGAYEVQRPFLLITPSDRDLNTAAADFMEFALSQEACQYILRAGVVPAYDISSED